FVVRVATGPARMCRVSAPVLHLQEVVNCVVHVALDVGAHGLAVAGGIETRVERIEGIWCSRRIAITVHVSAHVLAAAGLNQPVEGIVGVVVAWLDALIPEVDRVLRVVLYVRDVPGRIVRAVEVLKPARLSCRGFFGGSDGGRRRWVRVLAI